MDINWSRYIEIARAQDLGSAEVARLIRTETVAKSTSPKLSGACPFRSQRQLKFDSLILWTLLIFAKVKQMRSRR